MVNILVMVVGEHRKNQSPQKIIQYSIHYMYYKIILIKTIICPRKCKILYRYTEVKQKKVMTLEQRGAKNVLVLMYVMLLKG